MLALALLAMIHQSPAPTQTLYVGTYTDPNGSKGIYEVRLNTATGALSEAKLVAQSTAPSYMCMRPDGKYLYAVNESSSGEASAFEVAGGSLRKLNTVTFDGKGPCHISVDPNGKWLFVSAYGGGTVQVLPIRDDGSIGEATDGFKNSGSGPNLRRQEAPHLHFARLVGSHLYACDLGTDQVLRFDFDENDGKLRSAPFGKTEPGAGPRHLAASKDGMFLYVNNEMGMSLSVFSRDPTTGNLRLIQTHPSLENMDIQDSWTTSAIKLHPKLPMIYVSNRGHNSITQFEIQRDGSVAWRSVLEVDVVEPRDFAIDASGKWLVVAGQKSGELQAVQIDPKTGSLEARPKKAKVSKPACVVFAP